MTDNDINDPNGNGLTPEEEAALQHESDEDAFPSASSRVELPSMGSRVEENDIEPVLEDSSIEEDELIDLAAAPVLPPKKTKSPGVYTRDDVRSPHELDMLWSGSRGTLGEERAPMVFIIGGVLIGAVITGLIFSVLTKEPDIKAGDADFVKQEISAPVANEVADDINNKPAAVKEQSAPSETVVVDEPVKAETVKPVATPAPVKGPSKATTYVVSNGDTLEKIARKYYGSGHPSYIEKIRRANNLKSAHFLSIGQKLTIPPKNY